MTKDSRQSPPLFVQRRTETGGGRRGSRLDDRAVMNWISAHRGSTVDMYQSRYVPVLLQEMLATWRYDEAMSKEGESLGRFFWWRAQEQQDNYNINNYLSRTTGLSYNHTTTATAQMKRDNMFRVTPTTIYGRTPRKVQLGQLRYRAVRHLAAEIEYRWELLAITGWTPKEAKAWGWADLINGVEHYLLPPDPNANAPYARADSLSGPGWGTKGSPISRNELALAVHDYLAGPKRPKRPERRGDPDIVSIDGGAPRYWPPEELDPKEEEARRLREEEEADRIRFEGLAADAAAEAAAAEEEERYTAAVNALRAQLHAEFEPWSAEALKRLTLKEVRALAAVSGITDDKAPRALLSAAFEAGPLVDELAAKRTRKYKLSRKARPSKVAQ